MPCRRLEKYSNRRSAMFGDSCSRSRQDTHTRTHTTSKGCAHNSIFHQARTPAHTITHNSSQQQTTYHSHAMGSHAPSHSNSAWHSRTAQSPHARLTAGPEPTHKERGGRQHVPLPVAHTTILNLRFFSFFFGCMYGRNHMFTCFPAQRHVAPQ
jgi:hypothetical protein